MSQAKLNGRSRGHALLYTVVAMPVMVGFVALAVDWGSIQLCKGELQAAADAAARGGAAALSSSSAASPLAGARAVASANRAGGKPVDLADADVRVGHWDAAGGRFADGASPTDAVEVTARRELPLLFSPIIGGRRTVDLAARAVATYAPHIDSTNDLPATSNPWLAAMPDGTVANPNNKHTSDTAPAASPKLAAGLPIAPGTTLTFDSIKGSATYGGASPSGPDGTAGNVVHNSYGGSEHGKSDLYCPINSVVGVFLSDADPSRSPAPPVLNFSTAASRNFAVLEPQLKQTFFIGDGKTAAGAVQQFVVPPGATRLYLGVMDAYEWNNNKGSYTTVVKRPTQLVLVK